MGNTEIPQTPNLYIYGKENEVSDKFQVEKTITKDKESITSLEDIIKKLKQIEYNLYHLEKKVRSSVTKLGTTHNRGYADLPITSDSIIDGQNPIDHISVIYKTIDSLGNICSQLKTNSEILEELI